jgi:toxin YoeB
MNNIFSKKAWEDYLYWQMNDKATIRKINDLIKDIGRNGIAGR